MPDLGLQSFNKLYPMMIRKYQDLVVDQNASEKDKINDIIQKLNALGKLSNDVVRDWNTVYNWAMNDGLNTDVSNKLEEMRTNGEISQLLQNIYDSLVGSMSNLHTSAKDLLVNAINEVDDLAKANQTAINTNTANIATNTTNIATNTTNIASNTSALAQNASQISNLQYYVSTKSFPRNAGETDDAPRIMRAINSLPNGGKVILEATTYLVASTLTIPQNITLSGQGYGKWTTGTAFHFTGSGACINFSSTGNADGIVLENFKIYSNSGDASYQNFTGIDVNCAELMTIRNVMIQYANIGIKCSATSSYIYLLNIDNVFIYNCKNEGILVPVPGGSNWSNGIRIKVGDISNNNIGIHCFAGLGNSIIGDGSEVGANTTGGILIEGGVWTIKGSLWIENSPYGIQTTGGHTTILDEIYCAAPINQVGGTLYIPNKQAIVNRISAKMLKRNLVAWFSFEEGSGLATYDRVTSAKGTFDVAPTWNPSSGQFGSTVQTPSGKMIALPSNLIDWTQDWTFLLLGYGANSNYLMAVQGSDSSSIFSFSPYANGTQFYTNWSFKSNFPSYPNGDATTTMNWHIVSYKASTGVITVYNQLGRVMATYTNTLSSVFSAPTWVRLANNIVIDEFILYNRILSDSEIRGITELTIPPDVRNLNNKVMTSPDGSMWKQTIDNTGVTTWTKL